MHEQSEVRSQVRAGCYHSLRGDVPGKAVPMGAGEELSLEACVGLAGGAGGGSVLQAEGLQGTGQAGKQRAARGVWG